MQLCSVLCHEIGAVTFVNHLNVTQEYEKGEKVMQLPCKHGFHSDCVRGWLQSYSKHCPGRGKVSPCARVHLPLGQRTVIDGMHWFTGLRFALSALSPSSKDIPAPQLRSSLLVLLREP